jgi:DNA-binding NtrC family response regulator
MAGDLTSPLPQKVSERVLRPHRNVLVIEDDTDTATVVCNELLRVGYGARHVPSRDEALKVLDLYIYDYIIMDFLMPGMSAKDFVQQVATRRPNTRIIPTTAERDIGPIATELGLLCCLPKPIIPEQVPKILQHFDVK